VSETGSHDRGEWESLAPWEKAAQWRQTAPDIADEVIALAKSYAEKELKIQQDRVLHDFQLTAQQERHRERMDLRAWWLEMLLTVGALVAIAGSIVLSWKYASAGHVFPGLGVLGVGGAASVGIYTTGRAAIKKTRRQIRGTVITPEEILRQDGERK
jgi:hypothetical protein